MRRFKFNPFWFVVGVALAAAGHAWVEASDALPRGWHLDAEGRATWSACYAEARHELGAAKRAELIEYAGDCLQGMN